MKIYCLKWLNGNGSSTGDVAYTDKERADELAEWCNKHKSWYARMLGCRYIVTTLELKEGPGRKRS